MRFDRAYTTACWSVPAHASLCTGLLLTRHGAHDEHMSLDRGLPTPAEVLARRGYETAAFTPNPYVSSGTGLTRGFTLVEESWRGNILRQFLAAGQLWGRLGLRERDKGGAEVVVCVRRWLEGRGRSRPYFLFVNLLEAHAPYHEVPANFRTAFVPQGTPASRIEDIGRTSDDAQWLGRKIRAEDLSLLVDLLDGATACADHYLGQILDAIGEETITIVLSDHGEALAEHGLHGHMAGLYEPLIRVPLVMAGPGLPRGRTFPDPVSILDVMPTVLGLVGIGRIPSDGLDLRLAVGGLDFPQGRVVTAWQFRADRPTQLWGLHRSAAELAEIRARKGAAVGRSLKRIVTQDGKDSGFDLVADPGEQRPFLGPLTGLSVEVPESRSAPLDPAEALDPAQRKALRSLGYVH